MPSKKDLAFQADVLERLHKLEDANTALRRDASSFSLTTSTRLTSLEDTDVHERLASLETSGDAVKYMWESIPTMMAEIRQKHESLASSISDIRSILSAVKSEQEREERDAKFAIEHDRTDALNTLREYIQTSQEEMQGIKTCFEEAMKTLKPVPSGATMCRWCHHKWWEHGRSQGDYDPRVWGRGARGTRTRNRCYKCDEVWEPVYARR
jgi:phage-related minor tail protein